MCKFQAFCLLVLTLLVFSQETPVPPNSQAILLTIQRDVSFLKQGITVNNTFRIPTDVPGNCTLYALACFGGMMAELERKHKNEGEVTNAILNIITNIKQIIEMKLNKTVTTRALCSNKECKFHMVIKNTPQVLQNLLDFLKHIRSQK